MKRLGGGEYEGEGILRGPVGPIGVPRPLLGGSYGARGQHRLPCELSPAGTSSSPRRTSWRRNGSASFGAVLIWYMGYPPVNYPPEIVLDSVFVGSRAYSPKK